jgi:ADP-heptose:LPS heptosyltransferase
MPLVVLSPFSNSDIRDWPAVHYQSLASQLLIAISDLQIRVIGTASQALRANEIVRGLDGARFFNDCGRLSWPGVKALCLKADCLVGNNSGVSHQAAALGTPVVTVFGGSHLRQEWRPLGTDVTVISAAPRCSPCHIDHGAHCPFDKMCLTSISPETVATVVLRKLQVIEKARISKIMVPLEGLEPPTP